MTLTDRQLNLVVDMYGCPNRCAHCWLGHMPNRRMADGADEFIMERFSPYFDKIAFYSWLREPDFCADYRNRWFRDIALSKNARPQRFELASFYRIVRDEAYIPFLKETGVKKVQLTFFGLKETQDRYVGRKGAFEEVLRATELLIESGIVPRWQCFINEENKGEIKEVLSLAEEIRRKKCPDLEFFVHEGSCDGENRKLYSIRIQKQNIPKEIIPVFLDYDRLTTEKECCEQLLTDFSHPDFHNEGDITLNISNTYDVYYNFTHMTPPWIIGSLKSDDPDALIHRIVGEDTFALNAAKRITWAELTKEYGDLYSERVFGLDDFKIYLFNNYLDSIWK